MALFQTQSLALTALAGQTFSPQFVCFQDDAFTLPFDLTGYAFEAVFKIPDLGEDPAVTLTQSSGITVSATDGLISMEVDDAITAAWPVGRGRWYLQATDADGAVSYPLRGILFVGNP